MGRWLSVSYSNFTVLFFILITGALGWIGYNIFSMVKLQSTHTETEWLKTNIKSQPHPLEPVTDSVKDKPQTFSEMPSILPILVSPEGETKSYEFSSGFGYRTHPTTKRRQFHFGLDISTSTGTPVIATADGVIVAVETDAFWGNVVKVHHQSNQIGTLYGHLGKYAEGIHVGKKVTRGEIIGYVGSSGQSTGPHLHYSVYTREGWKDPLDYIPDVLCKF